ncbi:MAG: DinB family protein [Bacteroidota bacterium]
MKNRFFIFILFTTMSTAAQQATVKGAFLEKWENSKTYLIDIADQMPEEHFDFKPTEQQRTFQEQLLHIKGNIDWLSGSYFSSSEYKKEALPETLTKAETLELLKASFEAAAVLIEATSEETLSDTVSFFAGPKTKLQILNLLQDHVTHHRGQLLVYLNLKDIKPHRYVGW